MPPNEPKDLGVKIGTKVEVLWTKVKKEAGVLIEQSENNLVVQHALLDVANMRIAEEKAKK